VRHFCPFAISLSPRRVTAKIELDAVRAGGYYRERIVSAWRIFSGWRQRVAVRTGLLRSPAMDR